MLKANQLRQVLINSVPLLQQNPDNLTIAIQSGNLVSTLASSLSFEYHFQLAVTITDYAEDIDLIMVPLLTWLRKTSPTSWFRMRNVAPALPSPLRQPAMGAVR